MTARDDILGGIRRALKRGPLAGKAATALAERVGAHRRNLVPARATALDHAGRVALFVAMAEEVQTTVSRIASEKDVPDEVARYLAAESSAQCGPCFFALRALSDAIGRVAERGTNRDDLARLKRWAVEVQGRGACKHPDGAVIFLRSALSTFADSFASHPAHWRQQPA